MTFNRDFKEFLELLNENNVEYLVVEYYLEKLLSTLK